jgi:hypothetical protein
MKNNLQMLLFWCRICIIITYVLIFFYVAMGEMQHSQIYADNSVMQI